MQTATHKGNELLAVKMDHIDPTHVSYCGHCYFGHMRTRQTCEYGVGRTYYCTGIVWMDKPSYVAWKLTK
jgi:hypothetical protein